MFRDETVVERTFMALADLARRSREQEITSELLYEVVCEWTTDEITEDGPVGSDSMVLGSYMVEHLSTQSDLQRTSGLMEDILESLTTHQIDPSKLAEQDPDEWQKLNLALAVGPDSQFAIDEDAELTVADILAVTTTAPPEGNWEDVTNAALLEKIDHQLFINEVVALFLQATLNGDDERMHEIIDDLDCDLVHGLTNLILIWVRSRNTIGEDETLEEWIAGMEAMAEDVSNLSEAERIEFAKKHLISFDD